MILALEILGIIIGGGVIVWAILMVLVAVDVQRQPWKYR